MELGKEDRTGEGGHFAVLSRMTLVILLKRMRRKHLNSDIKVRNW